jgi:hypothetical protein
MGVEFLVQEREQALAPAGHAGVSGRQDRDVLDVVGRAVEVDVEPLAPGLLERGDDVGLVLVAVACRDRDEAQAEVLDCHPLRLRHVRDPHGVDLHEHDSIVDDAIVLGVVEKGGRDGVERGGQEDGRPGDPA